MPRGREKRDLTQGGSTLAKAQILSLLCCVYSRKDDPLIYMWLSAGNPFHVPYTCTAHITSPFVDKLTMNVLQKPLAFCHTCRLIKSAD